MDQDYVDYMINHPFGIALYHPISTELFRPGSCGYFDDSGNWNPIWDLTAEGSKEEGGSGGFSKLNEDLSWAPTDGGIQWGPKISQHVRAIKSGFSAGTPDFLTAVSAEAMYSFSSDSSAGAVLLTKPPITHTRIYYESPFKTWVRENASLLLQKRPEVRENGFWIVTSTYSTKACAINMWRQRGKSVKVGFKVKAVSLGECGPSGEWYEDHRDGGWNHYEGKDGDGRVVFFGGLKFQYKRVLNKKDLKHTTGKPSRTLRSDAVPKVGPEVVASLQNPDESESAEMIDVECEEFLEKLPVAEEDDDGDDW